MSNVSCRICSNLSPSSSSSKRKPCETFLLDFLLQLKLNGDEIFQNSIFVDSKEINRIFCNGLTLMHVNILGDRISTLNDDEEEEETDNFQPVYDESDAIKICEILLQRGASANGNSIYEMRPLHIAIRRDWPSLTEVLLRAGANPNLAERDIYASRPMDIAVLNDDSSMVKLLHRYGAFLNGFKTMFHLAPLAEAFVRGYFDVFRILLEMGARPQLELDRNTFRSFGHELFLNGEKGRQDFIQLLYDHGCNIENEFKVHAIRIEPDGIFRHEPKLEFACEPICIVDVDSSIFVNWICRTRSLKKLCRLTFRRFCFEHFDNGFRRLELFKEQCPLNRHLYNFIMFENESSI